MRDRFFKQFLLMMSLVLVGCNQNTKGSVSTNNNKTAEYHKITAEEAKKLLDENSDVILLDVRTESEYKEEHIKGAILIPDYEIKDKANSILTDKDAIILVYCRSGNRSKGASKELVSLGYTNVYDFGAIGDWKYETVSE